MVRRERPAVVGTDFVALFARIALGLVFLYHGYQLVFRGGNAHITEMLVGREIPHAEALGWLAAFGQLFGGAGMILGFLARLWGLVLAIIMGVAVWTVHWPHGWDISQNGMEFAVVMALLALGVLIGGPGAFSVDRLIFGRGRRYRTVREEEPPRPPRHHVSEPQEP